MANLTTDNIKTILKENNKVLMKEVKNEIRDTVKTSEVSVKKYITEYVGDATDKILGTMQTMFNERDVKIDQLSKDMTDVKQDIKFMHQDIKDLEVDFSDKPSKHQFEEFKSKFKNYTTL